ncbi:MAG: YraN family protein [Candidatus Poribacteria bacterium]|nr:YraN family protein [Candidatus Poribacteria bacterium]
MRGVQPNIAKIGETVAADHLKTHGYQILAHNYRYQRGEIDLIAKKGNSIVFVEVKTRRSLKYGTPQHAVTKQKQQQISKIALAYLQTQNLLDSPCRFDVIAILLSPQCEVLRLEQIESAFDFQPEPNMV